MYNIYILITVDFFSLAIRMLILIDLKGADPK